MKTEGKEVNLKQFIVYSLLFSAVSDSLAILCINNNMVCAIWIWYVVLYYSVFVYLSIKLINLLQIYPWTMILYIYFLLNLEGFIAWIAFGYPINDMKVSFILQGPFMGILLRIFGPLFALLSCTN